jgi:hypothetical protein
MRKPYIVGVLALGCVLSGGWSVDVPAQGIASRSNQSHLLRCGVKSPTALEQDLIEAQVSIVEQKMGTSAFAALKRGAIPVHVHIITTTSGDGNVSSLVPAQINVLNAAYKASGFQFKLASVQVVANNAWFTAEPGSPEEIAMKDALREGGPDALNIYTLTSDAFLGWATFPHDAKHFPRYDGVVLNFGSLPGGGIEFPVDPAQEPDGMITYDEGDTGTHEVGHWLGLYHTFEAGCGANGDRIRDTPAEAEPQFFCAPRDSCVANGRKADGSDPITNYMDYVDDVCMTDFTPDQAVRMDRQWKTFRQ